MLQEWWTNLGVAWKIVAGFLGGIAIIAGGWSPVMRVLGWWKTRKLREYAQALRAYSDRVKTMEPNHLCFPRSSIDNYFEGKLPFYLKSEQVIEFMEEKRWATKVHHPPDCWKIT